MTLAFFEAGQAVLKSVHPTRGRGFMPAWASWSIKEASEKTGYHPEYIRQLASSGKIEAEKLGQMWLIRIDSLKRYIEEAQGADDGRYGPKVR